MVTSALPWRRVTVLPLVPHLSADAGSLSNKNQSLQNSLWRKVLYIMSSKPEPIFFPDPWFFAYPVAQYESFSPWLFWLYLSWPILLQTKACIIPGGTFLVTRCHPWHLSKIFLTTVSCGIAEAAGRSRSTLITRSVLQKLPLFI